MQMRKYQTGLGSLGWLVVLAIASFLLTCLFKVGPIYLEYWQTKKALDLVLGDPVLASKSKDEIARVIDKQLEVSGIESIKTKDIKVNDSKGGRELDASYEKRVSLISNIDVVVKFEKLKYSLSGTQ